MHVKKYLYRKLFGLSAEEMENEPIDDFFTNLQIYAWIEEKKQREQRMAEKGK